MDVTNEQQYVADKLVEAAWLLQHCLREAHKVGVSADVTVYGTPPVVHARAYVAEERELRSTEEATQKARGKAGKG